MDFSKFIRPTDLHQLESNWTKQQPLKGTEGELDFQPVVKLFNPCGSATWLITEKEPNSSLAFGLCDLGMGEPEMGYVCLEEIFSLKLRGNLTMEQDLFFKPTKTLNQYTSEARRQGYIRA